jgi:hypothetical protein
MKNYDRIIVLGSGFSKSFSSCMHSMNDLTNQLFDDDDFFKSDRNSELKEMVEDFKSFCSNILNIQTIESITTTIFSKRIFRDFYEEERFNRLQQQILLFIFEKLKDSTVDLESENTLYRFLQSSIQKPLESGSRKNLLLTFNYDLLIENFLKKYRDDLQLRIDYGVKLRSYRSFADRREEDDLIPFQMLKLHGSFNWFNARGSTDTNINSIYRVDPDDENFFIHENDVPVFIPMVHAKELFLKGTLYNTLWTKAAYYLDKAKEICFLGYGFPATDINNLLFFGNYRDKITKIVVYHSEKDSKELTRLQQLFGTEKVVFSDAKAFLNDNYSIFSG